MRLESGQEDMGFYKAQVAGSTPACPIKVLAANKCICW